MLSCMKNGELKMAKYLACGNIMSDYIINPGSDVRSERHMGGPAFYALSGIKLWEDDVKLVTRTGADWTEDYEKWMDANRISKESVKVDAEHVTTYQIAYDIHGKAIREKSYSFYGDQAMGYLKTHPCDIEAALGADTAGIYKAEGADRVVWKQLGELKKRHGFKVMWELEFFHTGSDPERIAEAMPYADAWSLNHTEAAFLFGIPGEDDLAMLRKLQSLPIPCTFYRVGKRGAYAVTPLEAYFCEAIDTAPYVDQTGCGNSSTGAFGYALFAGCSLREALVMANVTSGFNCAQFGPVPLVTEEIRARAKALAAEYLPAVKKVL